MVQKEPLPDFFFPKNDIKTEEAHSGFSSSSFFLRKIKCVFRVFRGERGGGGIFRSTLQHSKWNAMV